MGADYFLYTEVKRKDGLWHALNGQYYNESTGQYEMTETYHSGSRTYFSRTYDKLRNIGRSIKISDLSKEVLSKEDWLNPLDDDSYAIAVSLNDLRKSVPRTSRHQCCGYVNKRHIWESEVEGAEIECYLSAEEYDELSDAEKKEYEFYEWDDPTDWFLNIKEILSIVEFQTDEYMRVNCMWHEPTEIRLICIASY